MLKPLFSLKKNENKCGGYSDEAEDKTKSDFCAS
jgi:hypothetical protein